MNESKFLSVNQIVKALGASRPTVARWLADGTVPSVKLGGRRLIPAAFIDNLERKAAESVHATVEA